MCLTIWFFCLRSSDFFLTIWFFCLNLWLRFCWWYLFISFSEYRFDFCVKMWKSVKTNNAAQNIASVKRKVRMLLINKRNIFLRIIIPKFMINHLISFKKCIYNCQKSTTWTYGHNYRFATLFTTYLTVSRIIIPSLKAIGQLQGFGSGSGSRGMK